MGAREKKLRGQHLQSIAVDVSPIVLNTTDVMNHQVPSMTGKHVSNLAGPGSTCSLACENR